MKITLNKVSYIRFGFYTQALESGNVPYLQVRQFDEYGILKVDDDHFIDLDQKSESHLLKDGDVLFVGKGNRLFAWCYRETAGPHIASSIFFVLRPDQKIIYPEYLTAFLNAPQTKFLFQQLGAGTNIFSIRKSELGALEIPLLPITTQRKVAALAILHQQDILLAQKLNTQKQELYKSIISKLIK